MLLNDVQYNLKKYAEMKEMWDDDGNSWILYMYINVRNHIKIYIAFSCAFFHIRVWIKY